MEPEDTWMCLRWSRFIIRNLVTHNRGQYVICCVCICNNETLGVSTVVSEKLAYRETGKEDQRVVTEKRITSEPKDEKEAGSGVTRTCRVSVGEKG